ncbi:EGF-containing fibulin-like extracellular matrix protein 2 [Anser cygnoides]
MDGYEWDPETEHCKDVDECRARPPCPGALRCLNHFGGFLCLPPGAALITAAPPLSPPPPFAPPPPLAPPLAVAPPHGGRCPPATAPPPTAPAKMWTSAWAPPPAGPARTASTSRGVRVPLPPGYRNVRTECVDEDECRLRFCQHACANSPGSFSCRCHPGFRLAPNNRSCLDVDECSMGARCAQRCLNTFGSFRCRCRPGFALSADGLGCDDVDECRLGLARCQHRCQNREGGSAASAPRVPPAGGRRCQDVDECAEGTHGCSEAQRCFNTFGGHRCEPRQPCAPPTCPCPAGTGRAPAPGVPACSLLPPGCCCAPWPCPAPPDPRRPLPAAAPPGPPAPCASGGAPGAFLLRELSGESALLELRRPLRGPRELRLELELRGGAGPPRGPRAAAGGAAPGGVRGGAPLLGATAPHGAPQSPIEPHRAP